MIIRERIVNEIYASLNHDDHLRKVIKDLFGNRKEVGIVIEYLKIEDRVVRGLLYGCYLNRIKVDSLTIQSCSGLEGRFLAEIADYATSEKCLKRLILRDITDFDNRNLRELRYLLGGNEFTLLELRLSNVNLSFSILNDWVRGGSTKDNNLQILDISHNNLSHATCRIIPDLIRCFPNIFELDMRGNPKIYFEEESRRISSSLYNSSIYSLHYDGHHKGSGIDTAIGSKAVGMGRLFEHIKNDELQYFKIKYETARISPFINRCPKTASKDFGLIWRISHCDPKTQKVLFETILESMDEKKKNDLKWWYSQNGGWDHIHQSVIDNRTNHIYKFFTGQDLPKDESEDASESESPIFFSPTYEEDEVDPNVIVSREEFMSRVIFPEQKPKKKPDTSQLAGMKKRKERFFFCPPKTLGTKNKNNRRYVQKNKELEKINSFRKKINEDDLYAGQKFGREIYVITDPRKLDEDRRIEKRGSYYYETNGLRSKFLQKDNKNDSCDYPFITEKDYYALSLDFNKSCYELEYLINFHKRECDFTYFFDLEKCMNGIFPDVITILVPNDGIYYDFTHKSGRRKPYIAILLKLPNLLDSERWTEEKRKRVKYLLLLLKHFLTMKRKRFVVADLRNDVKDIYAAMRFMDVKVGRSELVRQFRDVALYYAYIGAEEGIVTIPGLSSLLKWKCKLRIKKRSQVMDTYWRARKLSTEQVRYACEDVVGLGFLVEWMKENESENYKQMMETRDYLRRFLDNFRLK